MKKILALFLIILSLFSVVSCKENQDFPPVESSEEEAKVLFTFSYEKETYAVKYELYRALFLNFSKEYDNGNKDFWNLPESSDAKVQINETITSYCADIFAAIHQAKKIGFDAYSAEADMLVEEYISQSVNGTDDGIEGFGGDYQKYLDSLKAMNLNYSVQDLLYRYALSYDAVVEYYKGTSSEDNPSLNVQEGKLEYTDDDIYSFYFGADSAHISIVEINSLYVKKERAQQIRDKIASFNTQEEALKYAVSNTSGDPDDILNGAVIGKNSMDSVYYSDVIKAAFSLEYNETSDIIEIVTDTKTSYWIIYKQEKNSKYYDEFKEEIESVYVSEKIGEILANSKNSLIESKNETDAFEQLKLSEISMK